MTPVVRFLLIANVATFFLQRGVSWITEALEFVPIFAIVRPWTVVTYMFLHADFMHIAFNMIALVFFGPRVEDRLGSDRFTILYFLSGFTGALMSTIFTPASAIIGASAGVFGVMLAFAHFWPNAPLLIWGIFPVPARMLVIFTTILTIWSGFTGVGGNVAHFAHLGGYAGAWLYVRWLDRASGAFRRKATAAPATVTKQLEGWRTIDLSKVHEVNREEVGRLLEKIRLHGLGALTGPERVFLSGFLPNDQPTPKS
jgi:membrane associated rhomboid family serine protease